MLLSLDSQKQRPVSGRTTKPAAVKPDHEAPPGVMRYVLYPLRALVVLQSSVAHVH